jgi:hypothetical protein
VASPESSTLSVVLPEKLLTLTGPAILASVPPRDGAVLPILTVFALAV